MKKLVCELCGGNEFTKNDGFWICNYCNTRYSLEEAKKIMVEGTVDVKVDKSEELINYEKLAFQNYNNGLYERALKYLDKVLEITPEDWKVTFLRGMCSARTSNLRDFRVLEGALAAKDAVVFIQKLEESDEIKNNHIAYMAIEINNLAIEFQASAQDHYDEFWELDDAAWEFRERLDACLHVYEYAFSLFEMIQEEKNDLSQVNIAKNIINCCAIFCEPVKSVYAHDDYGNPKVSLFNPSQDYKQPYYQKFDAMASYVKKNDPNYNPPNIKGNLQSQNQTAQNDSSNTNGGCYIATSIYGSYDCPEVWVLRRFRDYRLSTFYLGRKFISLYYFASPKIIHVLGRNQIFRNVTKGILNKFVSELKHKGYKDSSYRD